MNELLQTILKIIENRLAIIQQQALERLSSALNRLLVLVVLGFIALLFAVSLTFGFAIYLNYLLESPVAGFFIMAAFFLIMGVVLVKSLASINLVRLGALLLAYLFASKKSSKKPTAPLPTQKQAKNE